MRNFRLGVVAVLAAVAVVFVGAPANAAAGTITAAVSKGTVDPGQTLYVVGKVTPPTLTPVVVVQRLVAGKWLDRASGSVNKTTGAYKIAIKPSSGGLYSLRVRSNGRTIVSKTTYLRVYTSSYLTDLEPVKLDGAYETEADLNGKYYPKSIHVRTNPIHFCEQYTYASEYNLSRKYSRLVVVAGWDDDEGASGAVADFAVRADGVVVASGQLATGSFRAIDVSVSGKLRLRLEVTRRCASGPSPFSVFAWGNPKLKR